VANLKEGRDDEPHRLQSESDHHVEEVGVNLRDQRDKEGGGGVGDQKQTLGRLYLTMIQVGADVGAWRSTADVRVP
jgi:hypothetical protein